MFNVENNITQQQEVSIVGSGIVGLVTAVTLKQLLPELKLDVFDAAAHPVAAANLTSATFGQGRDARHFTGTESLSYQNPVHSRALRLAPSEHQEWAGWRLIPEAGLSDDERRWRSDSAHRFTDVGHDRLNAYDDLHAQLNYGGMAAWDALSGRLEYISGYRISPGPVRVLFQTAENFHVDLESEADFLQKFGPKPGAAVLAKSLNESDNLERLAQNGELYGQSLAVPGSSWRIRSLGLRLLAELESQGVDFHWNQTITESSQLPSGTVIWSAGTTHALPDLYRQHALVQGIAGCWVSIPNPGYNEPFKISLPQPSGYINCTPDGETLHISGGFGWVGERQYQEAAKLMEPITAHFVTHVGRYFGIAIEDMESGGPYSIGICVRPSSPTGLPEARVIECGEQTNVIITGSGKSGSTQAPLLALFAAEAVEKGRVDRYISRQANDQERLRRALGALASLADTHTYTSKTDYPAILERDLF